MVAAQIETIRTIGRLLSFADLEVHVWEAAPFKLNRAKAVCSAAV
jgi:hypothetical protein